MGAADGGGPPSGVGGGGSGLGGEAARSRLVRDADGDESNEFRVERADLGRLDGLSEISKR